MKAIYLGRCQQAKDGSDIPVVNRGVEFCTDKPVEVSDEHAAELAKIPDFFRVEGKPASKAD